MFVMRGKQNKAEFEITWNAGMLDGDEDAIMWLRANTKRMVGPPGGPYWEGDEILGNSLATFLLAYQAFGGVELISGELEQVPPVPEGAIP